MALIKCIWSDKRIMQIEEDHSGKLITLLSSLLARYEFWLFSPPSILFYCLRVFMVKVFLLSYSSRLFLIFGNGSVVSIPLLFSLLFSRKSSSVIYIFQYLSLHILALFKSILLFLWFCYLILTITINLPKINNRETLY